MNQKTNPYGFLWNLSASVGLFLINEIHIRRNHAEISRALPGQIKIGFWGQTGQSANPLTETTNSVNCGSYLIFDQMRYREPLPTGVRSEGKARATVTSPQGLVKL